MSAGGDAGAGVVVRVGSPDADQDRCIELLEAGYGEARFSPDWFRWKHTECPWGSSNIFLCDDEDSGDALGVAFGLPWRYRFGDAVVDGARTVDGATLPASRGRRVLGRVIRAELDRWDPVERPGVVVATATDAAQKSHERNGAITLPPITTAYAIAAPGRRARLLTGDAVLDTVTVDSERGLHTDWDPASLRWRTDPRSGHRYEALALAEAEEANGIVYRILAWHGVPIVVVTTIWGPTDHRQALLGALMRRERTVAALAPHGPGTDSLPLRPAKASGSATMCVWDLRPEADGPDSAHRIENWRLTHGEIEGLI